MKTSNNQPPVDVIVVGGGIAGLWILSNLRAAGYDAILVERDSLGSGQTLASQGIIHGGAKYALIGHVTGSSEAVRELPERWGEHLSGRRLPDLSSVRCNSDHQWMWSAGDIPSKIANFFAGRLMSGRVRPLAGRELPGRFKSICKTNTVYQLHEPVLDVASLVQCLADSNKGRVFNAEAICAEADGDNMLLEVRTHNETHCLAARALVYAAGEGNAEIETSAMQRRPLQMVMVKGDLPELWGHVIEAAANPRLTITSHKCPDGQIVWYIGGQLAEDGVARSIRQQIAATRQELRRIFPAVVPDSLNWATLHINRAEGIRDDGKRPDNPFVGRHGRQITVWPVKLVFAPVVADEVLSLVEAMRISKSRADAMIDLPEAVVGQYPWEQAVWQCG